LPLPHLPEDARRRVLLAGLRYDPMDSVKERPEGFR